MKEISLILKNNSLITVEEFRLLERYSCPGKIWTLIHKPDSGSPYFIRSKAFEYIFDPESLTVFCIVSQNILATWDTEFTRNLSFGQEFHLKDSLFLRPYLDFDQWSSYTKI